MRRNTNDQTLMKNYIQRYRFLVREYDLVKKKKHPHFKFVGDFYKFHHMSRQTFLKYYNSFYKTKDENSLLPQKRGPKWKTRRPHKLIENKVIELRKKGIGRYEIYQILLPK